MLSMYVIKISGLDKTKWGEGINISDTYSYTEMKRLDNCRYFKVD